MVKKHKQIDELIPWCSVILERYHQVRQVTTDICLPLEIEDYVIQGMDDVSPAKWHLAHTTWFFETMILVPLLKNYRVFHHTYHSLFNSYYQTVGEPYPRSNRGLLSRPTVQDIYAYRRHVDEQIDNLLTNPQPETIEQAGFLLTLGLMHEQQHQELLLMDIKFNLSLNPGFPVYSKTVLKIAPSIPIPMQQFIPIAAGLVKIGHDGSTFCYDNEQPRHQVFVHDYAVANRLVTNGEYMEFIENDGYKNPKLWLANGWDWVIKNHITAPLYWYYVDNQWYQFSLDGLSRLHLNEPVLHVSYYEADAYARWCGKRLPTEAEWEHFVTDHDLNMHHANLLETACLQPQPASRDTHIPQQFFGDAWEWTMSPYVPYPGYQAYAGNLAEYNGKFMSDQVVLRGGSCITPATHIRASYRNFFQAEKRWQFSGIRLATSKF